MPAEPPRPRKPRSATQRELDALVAGFGITPDEVEAITVTQTITITRKRPQAITKATAEDDEVAHPPGDDSRQKGTHRHPRNVRFFQEAAKSTHEVMPKGRNFH